MDSLVRIEALIGSRHNDTLTRNGRANYLAGLEGDDDMRAGGGNDYLDGGRGRAISRAARESTRPTTSSHARA
jgi:hypothetical protein